MRTEAQQAVHIVAMSVGFTSLALLWLSVVWGMVLSRGWALTSVKHSTLYGTHMILALLGLCLGVTHAVAQLAVPDGHVGFIDQIVPFTNSLDPVGIGVAVIAEELMLALAFSVLIQKKMGYHRWKNLHVLGYAAYTLLTAHVLLSGTDVGPPWVWGPVLAMWLVVVGLWASMSEWAGQRRRAAVDKLGGRLRGEQATVQVDPVKCARFGFCEQEAPALFELRGDRLAYTSAVPADQVPAAINAARVCPARAITLSRAANKVFVASRPEEDVADEQGDPRLANVTGLRPRGGA